MSTSILELFEFQPRRDYRDDCYSKIKGDFPLLGAALVGNYDAKEKKGFRGGTLMVFIEDDVMKWTFHHKQCQITLFGSFRDLTLDLQQIEEAMAEGRYDRKKGRKA